MKQFIEEHGKKVIGVLSGWDRLALRGTLGRGRFSSVNGMRYYLNTVRVLLKDFAVHAKGMTEQLIAASTAAAQRFGRPNEYVSSTKMRKGTLARELFSQDPVEEGLVCLLRCVEPCMTFTVRGSRKSKKLELVKDWGKCLHLYHYFVDPVFGFMYARIQTWFPFTIEIGVNGREWLAQRMKEEGLGYRRMDNCFPWIEDFDTAQALMDGQRSMNWPEQLDRIARLANPAHETMFPDFHAHYYWTIAQSEWATDLCFDSHASLAAIYPQLTWGAIAGFSSQDVMRFLGKRPDPRFQRELISDYCQRPEGLRVKHRMDANSIKMYDKARSILRVETTINDPRPFQVFRPKEGCPEKDKQWLRMRRGIADQYRRAQVSHKCNLRYLDALAELDTSTRIAQLVEPLTKPASHHGKSVRALRPWSPHDQGILNFINRPELQLAGFRNRDMAKHLYPEAQTTKDKRKAAARVSYRLRILRAHGLIAKLPKTQRYRITPAGRKAITAMLLAQHATVQQLAKVAA